MSTFLTFTSAILVCHAAFSAHQYISLSSEVQGLPNDVFFEVVAAFVVLLFGQTVAKSSELKSIEKDDTNAAVRTLNSLEVPEYMNFNHRGRTSFEIIRSKGNEESKKMK